MIVALVGYVGGVGDAVGCGVVVCIDVGIGAVMHGCLDMM